MPVRQTGNTGNTPQSAVHLRQMIPMLNAKYNACGIIKGKGQVTPSPVHMPLVPLHQNLQNFFHARSAHAIRALLTKTSAQSCAHAIGALCACSAHAISVPSALAPESPPSPVHMPLAPFMPVVHMPFVPSVPCSPKSPLSPVHMLLAPLVPLVHMPLMPRVPWHQNLLHAHSAHAIRALCALLTKISA
eukprot:1146793-Pelagomonas_calceolata.AAC.12